MTVLRASRGGASQGPRFRWSLRLQRRILPQDRGLEPLQRRRRLDSELVDEAAARLLVELERLGLPPRAVERDHELAAQALPQRMLGDERLELSDEVGSPPQGEPGLEALLEGRQAQLLEPVDLVLREGLVDEVGERGALPERQRLLQAAKGRVRPRLRESFSRLLDQPLEPKGIDSIGLDQKLVARRAGHDGIPSEQLSQPGDVDLEGIRRSARRRRRSRGGR